MSRRYPEATTWLCDQVESVIVDGELDFPTGTYEEMRIGYQVGVDWVEFEGHSYIFVSDDAARWIVVWATKSAGYFDAVSRICAANIMTGAPLPLPLRSFVSDVLKGEFPRPKIGHRPRKKNWIECAYLYSLGKSAQSKFGLTLTRNDEGKHSYSVCDALAEALTVCGRKTTYGEIKRLYVHPDFARFREENQKVGKDYHHKESIKRIAEALMAREPPETPLSRYLGVGLEKD